MLQGRPLYDNAADAAYYVPPNQWGTITRALERQLNTLVVGQRGAGKTSLLRQLQRTLRDRGLRVAYVDATNLDGPMDLAQRLQDALLSPDDRGHWDVGAGLRPSSTDDASLASGSQTFLQVLSSLGTVEPSIALVDASSSGPTIYSVFGRMRDTMWQLPHRWVVAIDEIDRATVLRPPADAFFDKVVDLVPFSQQQLTKLLARRAPDVGLPMLEQVAELAQGNPRTALRAVVDVDVDGRDPATGLIERRELLERASAIGRPHAMLMAELLNAGAASPSDLELQQSLGITRARLTSLLRTLLNHGLVVAGVEKPDGVGRPRTIYRPQLGLHER